MMKHAIGRWSAIPLVVRQLAAAFGVAVVMFGLFFFIESLAETASGDALDPRPALLCLSLLGVSVVSYLVWPSRWNVLAHTQLAFGIVAYVIPVLLLAGGKVPRDEVFSAYTGIMLVGFMTTVAGTVFGAWLTTRKWGQRAIRTTSIPVSRLRVEIPMRVGIVAAVSIVGVLVAFAVMGFIPALAEDPFAAKFLRGEYASGYAAVAPLYRASTSALTVLLPVVTMYAAWRRKPAWLVLLLASFVILLLTLQREPTVSGILFFVGVVIARHRSGMILYFIGVVAVYFAGSASYFVLAALGIGSFASGVHISPVGLLASVAAGAPDVSDQFVFLDAWMRNPVYPHGLTFVGGLVPGNFEWNPAVWSLTVTNPGVELSTINSGGFRLPGALWGFVNFGWAGVVAVGLLLGVLTGFLARSMSIFVAERANAIAPAAGIQREHVVMTFVVYIAISDVATQFYALSYVNVIQTALVLTIVYAGLRIWRPRNDELQMEDEINASS